MIIVAFYNHVMTLYFLRVKGANPKKGYECFCSNHGCLKFKETCISVSCLTWSLV